MNKKIEELLNVLSVSEEEQHRFLNTHFTEKYFKTDEWPEWYGVCDILVHGDSSEQKATLANLAFKLRDDLHYALGWCAWDRACWEVWSRFHAQQGDNIAKREHLSQDTKEEYCSDWMMFWAEPIHWIIVALVTKEIAADPEEKFDAHLTSEDLNMKAPKTTKEISCISYLKSIEWSMGNGGDRNEGQCPECCGVSKKWAEGANKNWMKQFGHKRIEDDKIGHTTECRLGNVLNIIKDEESEPVRYGIAQSDGKGGFGFWDGPNPSLEEMLEVDGRDENSCIWRFNADGTDDLIYRWYDSEWIKVEEGEE